MKTDISVAIAAITHYASVQWVFYEWTGNLNGAIALALTVLLCVCLSPPERAGDKRKRLIHVVLLIAVYAITIVATIAASPKA